MNKKIITHFRSGDPILYSLIEKIGPLAVLTSSPDPFVSLCESIVSQQLSIKAADTIFKRFENLFEKSINPQELLQLSNDTIRQIGISYPKISYLKDLAIRVTTGKLDLANLNRLPDEEIIQELIAVRGIGKWTAEMFLMFYLGREDIFSSGDQGLKNALKRWYGLEKATTQEIEKVTDRWKPYRTYACRILWNSLTLK